MESFIRVKKMIKKPFKEVDTDTLLTDYFMSSKELEESRNPFHSRKLMNYINGLVKYLSIKLGCEQNGKRI